MPRYNSKHTLNSPRRQPRFSERELDREEHLPVRAQPVVSRQDAPGLATYYVSCDPRGLAPYLPYVSRHHQKGFRGALLAKPGLVLDPPSVVLLGYQNGDTFAHAMAWVNDNPIDEIAREQQKRPVVPIKEQDKAQERFGMAVATLEALAEQKVAAEEELELATAALILAQGVESVCIEGVYYDVSYSREKVYLKKRDPRFVLSVAESLAAENAAAKRKRKTVPAKKQRSRGRRAA